MFDVGEVDWVEGEFECIGEVEEWLEESCWIVFFEIF